MRHLIHRTVNAFRCGSRQPAFHAGRRRPLSSLPSVASVTIHPPPYPLPPPYFERPTPILLVQGEESACSGVAAWGGMVEFLTSRGCSVGTVDFGDGVGHASLSELEQVFVTAVRSMAAGPPVIIAHSVMALVAQKFLESHAARGMIFLDPFPPNPAARASRLLADLAKATDASMETARRGVMPWTALQEMTVPEHAVKLEPGAVPMLLVYTRKPASQDEQEERQAMATFHGVLPEGACVVNVSSGQSTQFVLADAIDAGFDALAYDWYDERF